MQNTIYGAIVVLIVLAIAIYLADWYRNNRPYQSTPLEYFRNAYPINTTTVDNRTPRHNNTIKHNTTTEINQETAGISHFNNKPSATLQYNSTVECTSKFMPRRVSRNTSFSIVKEGYL